MMRWLICLLLVSLNSCERSDDSSPHLVLYSSIDDSYARLVCREYEKSAGVKVDLVTDSEASKSSGLVQRLIAEKARPVADVFWSGDPMRAFKLEAAGVGTKVGGGPSRVRLIVFNTRLVSAKQAPAQVEELVKPEFAGRTCFANPLFGTSSMHAAVLLQAWGRERAERFFTTLSKSGGRMVASNGEVKRRVANGEFAFGITDSDDVAVGLGEGKNLAFIVPDQAVGDMGAVIIPAVPVLINNAPHSEAASQFADYLVSPQVQSLLAASDAEFLPATINVQAPVSHLRLDLSQLKRAPDLTASTAAEFEVWEREFLESWVAKQLQ